MPDSTNDTNKDNSLSTNSLASLVRNRGADDGTTTPWFLSPRMSWGAGFPAGAPLFSSSESPSSSMMYAPSLGEPGVTRAFLSLQSSTRTPPTTMRYCNDLSGIIDQALRIVSILEEDLLWLDQDEGEDDGHSTMGKNDRQQDWNVHQRRQ